MKLIKLSQNQVALVDDDDFKILNKHVWFAHKKPQDSSYYAVRNAKVGEGRRGVIIRMHRAIMSAQPSEFVDHINGDGLDNQKENLRKCSKAQNCRNSSARGVFKGVYFRKDNNKWRAQIRIIEDGIGRYLNIGHFDNVVAAATAYDKAAKQYHGEFARLNFP